MITLTNVINISNASKKLHYSAIGFFTDSYYLLILGVLVYIPHFLVLFRVSRLGSQNFLFATMTAIPKENLKNSTVSLSLHFM